MSKNKWIDKMQEIVQPKLSGKKCVLARIKMKPIMKICTNIVTTQQKLKSLPSKLLSLIINFSQNSLMYTMK